MTEQQIIQKVAEEIVAKEVMFTSVDLANEIKKQGYWVRNRIVAEWLRNVFYDASYRSEMISVAGGQAFLYHPDHADPDDYSDTDASAMTPDEFEKLHGRNPMNNPFPDNGSQSVQSSVGIGTDVVVKASNGRVRIPAHVVKKFGWQPGDDVDTDKIVTKFELDCKSLLVHRDGRVSIGSRFIGSGDSFDVAVTSDNDAITLTKI